jgi:putative transcriptional regulator
VKRDIGKELLEGIQAIKKGQGKKIEVEVPDDVKMIREHVGLSQAVFAGVLGISKRTLQDWEQGRRRPTGSAKALLRIAYKHPEVLTS